MEEKHENYYFTKNYNFLNFLKTKLIPTKKD